jgi:hypothetical protein
VGGEEWGFHGVEVDINIGGGLEILYITGIE